MANSFIANLKTEKFLPKEDKIAVVIKQFTLLDIMVCPRAVKSTGNP